MAKRQYKAEYLNLDFTYTPQHGIIEPQCVICAKFWSNKSFKHNKLRPHFEAKHSGLINKERSYSEREQKLKSHRLDAPTNAVVIRVQQATLALYLVAWRIARAKKAHYIGEELVNLASLHMRRTIYENEFANLKMFLYQMTQFINEFRACRVT